MYKRQEEGFVTAASKDGEEFEIKADTIIFAAGMKARTDEANTFFGIAQDTNIIGDANRVGTVLSLIHIYHESADRQRSRF